MWRGRTDMIELPPPYSAYEPGSFAKFTLEERFPAIVAEAQRSLPADRVADPRWHQLLDTVCSGLAIDTALLAPITPWWAERRCSLAGKSWRELGFMELEFVFYHTLNSLAGFPGHDLFAQARTAALATALPMLNRLLASAESTDFDQALDLALFGNSVDLSQVARVRGLASNIVVDERRALRAIASKACDIHLVADNAGEELCSDLLLCSALLEDSQSTVTLHLKPWPMFVSDALTSDVDRSLDAFAAGSTQLSGVAARLKQAAAEGRFVTAAAVDWGEPRAFDAMSPSLTATLAAADLVLLKGDLNYRRCIGDRSWPATTPIAQAANVPFGPTFALRVLKSEAVAGLAVSEEAALDAEQPQWRTNGKFAMVQRVDIGRPSCR
ncbi:MAG: hypothetical protein CL802_16330 [Citromicrobium sp.]|nr:hypothetical protein [Citromicrobium sp.]|tara:strand:- start:1896 stop:3047 length:1152 start_codon:yes stop_codon:yes gene_type:complete